MSGGHRTEALNSTTFCSVVYRDSIPIGFLYESLHGVDITAIDMENAYLNVPCVENIWFLFGYECRVDKGCILLIFHALYGLKYACFSCRSVLSEAFQ